MDWSKKENRKLVRAILALKTTNETERFLRDLMTEKEIGELARRLKAAEMLIEKQPYSAIEKETGLSSTTVARVAKWLNGKEGGYREIINRLHHDSLYAGRGLS
jgi:TrpR-related protein YerC/YecD